MSASPSQLDEIQSQLREHFASHPVISLRPTKGQPPDHYEITYTITGMTKADGGKIVESIDHVVELAIPFGFPHFPPSCKPKSDIFHPDFDPAAICLGDFWEQEQSLPDLITHIGQMINGEIYSTNNAFNEEAAEWYLDHVGKFPLANIKWGRSGDSTPSAQNRRHEIDTLDDSDLVPDFNFLDLEDEKDEDISLNTSFPEIDFSEKIDLQPFNLLEREKKFYTLLQAAETITNRSPQLIGLCDKAREEIGRAEKLHHDGKKFENKGDAQIALEKYQQITCTVADFPTIDADIRRIKQTLALLADISPSKNFDTTQEESLEERETADNSKTQKSSQRPPKTAKQGKNGNIATAHDLFLPKDHKKSSLPIYLLLGLTVIVIGAGGYLWYSFTDRLSSAETAYAQCSTAMANNQFKKAKQNCDKALQLVGRVKFIHQDFARQLEKFILEVLNSEKLTKGLAGYILLDGKYVPIAETKTLLSVKQQLAEADTLFASGQWQPAMEKYDALLTQIEGKAYLDQPVIHDMRRKRQIAEFKMFYDPAQIAIDKKQWEDAIEKLLQAQKVLVFLPESEREQYSAKLQNDLQKSQFANLKEQGDLSFTGTDWLSAIATYNQALASGRKTALPPESIDAIKNNIKRAELYNAINKGNKSFAAASWDEAIDAYGSARNLLVGDKGMPQETDTNANIVKLDRIILQAKIIRDRQLVQAQLKENALTKARNTQQQILTNIAGSPLKAEDEFSRTSIEISKAQQALDRKIYLQSKQAYLLENYQVLFIANYPTATADNLSNPVINFTKETTGKLIFKMQCTENDGGRPLNMVMFYSYDKKTGEWSFYSEK